MMNAGSALVGGSSYIQAANGRVAAFDRRSGSHFFGDGSPTYFEIVETSDAKAFIRGAHGGFLSAGPEGRVGCATAASGWEAFAVEPREDGGVRLRSFHGSYLAAGEDGRALVLTAAPPPPPRWIHLVPAFFPARLRDALARTVVPAAPERTVWTFWDRGEQAMCPFYRLNVEGWRRLLGPSWRVEVVNAVPGDAKNILRFVGADDLPATFAALSPVTQSEAVRLALLKRHGGVWMDATNVLIDGLDEICWRQIADPSAEMVLGGFCSTGWGSDHLDRRDYFESWFIAARKDNELVDCWHRTFNDYWNDRTVSVASWDHPLFSSIDLSNFRRYGKDFRDYLIAHIAFRRLIEHDPHMKAIWRANTVLRDAGDEAFLLTRMVGWDAEAIFHALIETRDSSMVERLLGTCLMKFTSSMVGRLAGLTREELLDERHTLGTIYRRVFARS